MVPDLVRVVRLKFAAIAGLIRQPYMVEKQILHSVHDANGRVEDDNG